MFEDIKTDWQQILNEVIPQEEQDKISTFLDTERKSYTLYPPEDQIFNCFNHFDFKETRVVLIGQDPYIRENQAMGLSFSVPQSQKKIPPSLRNIYKELSSDLEGGPIKTSGDLTSWAKQGVLLLNSALTVREGKSNSHKKQWRKNTDKLIKYISDNHPGVVFILWGNYAIGKEKYINSPHIVVKGIHPSPLSAKKGFFGSKPFSQTNAHLKTLGREPIDW